MRVAAIDIGTNSVLLLVAERRGGVIAPVLERATITRLGEGVDRARALAPEAVARTLACLAEYAEILRAEGVTKIAAVGTSAMRDAGGGEALRAQAKALLGVEPETISGDEEARLTFSGALVGIDLGGREATVFDLGGGSTEIIRPLAGDALRGLSLDIGSVRLTERHLRSDPPRPDELDAARADARSALAGVRAALGEPARDGVVVGVAGTVTTLAAHALGIAPYDAARVHGARLSLSQVTSARAELAALPLAERRLLPAVDPRRADVIVAGAVIVEEILAWAGAAELVVSDRGVRWGLAARLLEASTGA